MSKLFPIESDYTRVNMGGKNVPQWIVIHFVGASGQAKANANYFRNTYRASSAHYFVDPNRIIQVVPDNRQAWHIGDGALSGRGQYNGYHRYGATNANSIGIEMCQDTSRGRNAWEWPIHEKTYEQTLLLTKHLQKKYNIPNERVIRHFDASGKSCPGNWMANDWDKWKQFKADLAKTSDTGKAGLASQTFPISKSKGSQGSMYTIKVGDTLSKIAKAHGVTVNDLVKWNKIENPNLIFPETKLIVKQPQKVADKPKSGAFKFNTTVNVRNQASAHGPVHAKYYRGEVVNYDNIIENDGMLWLQYKSWTGSTQYVSAGAKTDPYGQFL